METQLTDVIMEKAERCDKALYALSLMSGSKVWDIGKLEAILQGKA